MKPDLPKVEQENEVSSHSQEIEYALLLQRMIDAASENPEQMRATVYGFARARLKIDASWATRPERMRLAAALETAIDGVERFSVRRIEPERLLGPTRSSGAGQLEAYPRQTAADLPSEARLRAITPALEDITAPEIIYSRSEVPGSAKAARPGGVLSKSFGFYLGIFLVAAAGAALSYRLQLRAEQGASILPSHAVSSVTFSPTELGAAQSLEQPASAGAKQAAPALDFPVPADYGVYVLSNGALSELHPLSERVPDKRIAMSTPVNEPSQTVLQDGRTRFILYRRDLAGNAPERTDVRVVAKVERALTFDAKGKPTFAPVSDAWNIRNISYEFRVRPIAGNPEMLLVQPEKADFSLSPGRYILVLKDQGYDFSISGTITDRSQCLERTDAANGSFYSECRTL